MTSNAGRNGVTNAVRVPNPDLTRPDLTLSCSYGDHRPNTSVPREADLGLVL